VSARHSEWYASVDPALVQGLDSPLLAQARVAGRPLTDAGAVF